MEIAQRIATARKERGLTQRQVAEALSVSVQAVSLWETSKAFPPSERLRRLATLLGVSSRWLAGDEDVLTPDRPTAPGATGHIIQLEELVHFLALRESERSRHYEEIIATRPGSGTLFAVRVTTKVLFRHMLNLAPHQVATDVSTPEGYSGDILVFDTGAVPEAGDYAVVIETETEASDIEKVDQGLRELPIRMSIGIRQIRESPEGGTGSGEPDGLVAKLKAAGMLEGVVVGQPTIVAVLVEERRLRGRAGRELYGKPLRGSGGPPVDLGTNADDEKLDQPGSEDGGSQAQTRTRLAVTG